MNRVEIITRSNLHFYLQCDNKGCYNKSDYSIRMGPGEKYRDLCYDHFEEWVAAREHENHKVLYLYDRCKRALASIHLDLPSQDRIKSLVLGQVFGCLQQLKYC